MNRSFKEELQVEDYLIKQKIVEDNFNLSPYEIKKKVKKLYPEVTTEEVEKIICDVSRQRSKLRITKGKDKAIQKSR